MTTLLAFVVTIALLVVFHELGHYWAARRCDVKVLRFSVGFGKPLYLRRGRDGVEWAISAIPLGGYVKMLDEREEPVAEAELDQAFNRKPVLQRMFIVAAGPVANLLLAILLYWVMFVHGVPGLKPVLGVVPQNTPAAAARMQPGETIVRIDGQGIPDWQELRWTLLEIALRQPNVKVEGRSVSGEVLFHELPLDALKPSDMEGEFLDKLGLHLHRPTILPVIGKLTADGAGSKAGLRAGDRILRANGNDLKQWDDLVAVVRSHPGQGIRLDIQRDGKESTLEIVPARIMENGVEIGQVGALPQVDKDAWKAMLTETAYGPLAAFGQSLRKTWDTAAVSLKMLGKMVLGEVSMKNLSGPITIADYAGQSAEMGVAAFLGFLALISISLGVLNLLPIPLLDGGHLLYYVAELAKGSPVSEEAWEAGQKIGIALLGTLMVFAIYNDITRLISG